MRGRDKEGGERTKREGRGEEGKRGQRGEGELGREKQKRKRA